MCCGSCGNQCSAVAARRCLSVFVSRTGGLAFVGVAAEDHVIVFVEYVVEHKVVICGWRCVVGHVDGAYETAGGFAERTSVIEVLKSEHAHLFRDGFGQQAVDVECVGGRESQGTQVVGVIVVVRVDNLFEVVARGVGEGGLGVVGRDAAKAGVDDILFPFGHVAVAVVGKLERVVVDFHLTDESVGSYGDGGFLCGTTRDVDGGGCKT